MAPTTLMTREATVTPMIAGAADEYNDIPLVAGSPFTVDCELQQTQRSEQTGSTDIQASGWTLFVPAGTTINGHDRVTVDGVIYEVDGPPWPAWNPRLHKVSHIECTLRVVA